MKTYEYHIAIAKGEINTEQGQELFWKRLNDYAQEGFRVVAANCLIVPESHVPDTRTTIKAHERYFAVMEREVN